jgi:hypothetical protein
MPRRPASITQADIARVIRAAKQAGAPWVEIEIGGHKVRIPVSSEAAATVDREREIVL